MNRFVSLLVLSVAISMSTAAFAEAPTVVEQLRAEVKVLSDMLPFPTEEGKCDEVKASVVTMTEGLKAVDAKIAVLVADESGHRDQARKKITDALSVLPWLDSDCINRMNRTNSLLSSHFMHIDSELMMYAAAIVNEARRN